MASTLKRFASAWEMFGENERNNFAGGSGANNKRMTVVDKKKISRPIKNSVTNGISVTSMVIMIEAIAAAAEPIR